jgi:two-component system, LytTR family, response regulator
LKQHPEVRLEGEADTFTTALSLLGALAYDLVFLDVRLLGGNGFDLVEFVKPGARIVFCTAYDAYALRAFEVNALDYLLKPVDPERLAQALLRVRGVGEPSSPGAIPVAHAASSAASIQEDDDGQPLAPLHEGDVVHLRTDSQTSRVVSLGDICRVAAYGNYTLVLLPGDKRVLMRRPLKDWEARLPSPQFVRVHRSELVNARRVRRVKRVSVSSYELTIDGLARPVRASYRYAAALRVALPELWS